MATRTVGRWTLVVSLPADDGDTRLPVWGEKDKVGRDEGREGGRGEGEMIIECSFS